MSPQRGQSREQGRGWGRSRPGGLRGVLLLAAVLAAGVAAWFGLGRTVLAQRSRIAALERIEARLVAERVPLRFKVLSREGGEIRVRFRFYDGEGREAGMLEGSWPGTELFVDFLVVPLGSAEPAWLAFPHRIFTDSLPAARGGILFPAYDRGGFPSVFDSAGLGAAERKLLVELFAEAKRLAAAGQPAAAAPGGLASSFGSAVHEVAGLASFEEGLVYRVVSRAKGGIEILEDEP